MTDPPHGPGAHGPGAHGSVAEEMAALAEALRARRPRQSARASDASTGEPDPLAGPPVDRLDTCEICPVCRAVAALHTVSPGAVSALADLAHQAEVTLRLLAADLTQQQSAAPQPEREDIPVSDLDDRDRE